MGVTKSKPSTSSIFVPLIYVKHLMNGGKVLNATWVAWFPTAAISPHAKI